MRKQRMAVSVLALLTLAACGTESGSGAGSGDSGDGSGTVRTGPSLTGVHWTVSSLTVGGKKTAAPAGAHVEIGPEGRATGNLGCNRFTADVEVEGDKVTVGPGTTTEMGCEEDVQEFEKAMGRALNGELKAAVASRSDGKTLTLTTAQGDSIVLTSEPPAPLTGTTWKVTGLVSGGAAASLPAGTEKKAHLTFGKDGSVEGNLGCNTFHGKAVVSGSALTFGPIASTRKMCADPEMELERALLGVLEGKTAYEIEHRSLSIEAKNGKGLAATAPAGK
ncbi:META domain-containing protein [Streptomyces sp. NPDC102441]|uniref:META domain-containing protein n=1 Tax=Streptomyces sp. NPDC102441 TaxID=3366176 RepID=UPI003804DE4B